MELNTVMLNAYAECHLSVLTRPIMLGVIMLSVAMLNVIMLSVVMLNVVMLSVTAQVSHVSDEENKVQH